MLFLFVGFVTVFLVVAAVVVDLSLWLAERRDVQKVADLAAAAGAQELPVDDEAAIEAVCEIAAANGRDGTCGITPDKDVYVQLRCNSGLSGVDGICNDAPGGAPSVCIVGSGCDTVRVTVRGQGPVLFSPIFEVEAATVSSSAAAGLGWGDALLDTVLLMDASGSMAVPGCNTAPPTPGLATPTPIPCRLLAEASTAASEFTELLLGRGGTSSRVGYAPYNFCYRPLSPTPQPFNVNQCVDLTTIQTLTTNSASVQAKVSATAPTGGTNACLGLLAARQLFSVPPIRAARRSVILLADGDNNFYYASSTTYPPGACHPSSDATQPTGTTCPPGASLLGERDIDLKTYQQAQALIHPSAGQPVEIYVVGFKVCGSDDGKTRDSAGYCGGIGNADPDNVADQRLLKCIASASGNYFRVSNGSDLSGVFRQVAGAILGRRLLQ